MCMLMFFILETRGVWLHKGSIFKRITRVSFYCDIMQTPLSFNKHLFYLYCLPVLNLPAVFTCFSLRTSGVNLFFHAVMTVVRFVFSSLKTTRVQIWLFTSPKTHIPIKACLSCRMNVK